MMGSALVLQTAADLSVGAQEEEEAVAFSPRDLQNPYSPWCLHLNYLTLLVLAEGAGAVLWHRALASGCAPQQTSGRHVPSLQTRLAIPPTLP